MTESVSICGLELPDGSMCKQPADGPQQPCKPHKLAPPGSASRYTARKELIGAIEEILKSAQSGGMLRITPGQERELATTIFNELTMHVSLKVLSGLALPPT